MTDPNQTIRRPLDLALATAVLAFAALLALFAIRNNDVWWMLAVGRYMVETRSFITSEPFTFTLSGAPWTPQSWLSAIGFYLVHNAAGAAGLVVLRALLVVATTAVVLRTLARVGASWAVSAVLVVVLLLVANTRFLIRAHLFGYLFLAVMMGLLLTSHRRTGRALFIVPVAVQLLWTNMHPSYLLGPALAILFYGGEWVSQQAGGGWVRPFHRHDYRRALILIGLLVAACAVNPDPLTVPGAMAGGEQRELMSRFTLEWKSPFDPAIAGADFHPWYEILLALAALAVVVSARRLPLAAVLMLAGTAYLSLQSHRFRVEFALVAVPLIGALLARAPAVMALRGAARARVTLAALAVVVMVATAPSRIEVDPGVSGRFPDDALAFMVENDIAYRPFNTIGYGSYMTWALYGERLHFIDGRNYDSALYRDFLLAQSNLPGLEKVIDTYRLDAFLIPAVHRSDAGMRNIHGWLREIGGWSLVRVGEQAFLYSKDDAVPAPFLDAHAYRYYHPLALGNRRISEEEIDGILTDLERAVTESPDSPRLWLDLAMVAGVRGRADRALQAVEKVLELDPGNTTALGLRGQLQGTRGR
jgi:hypothetical protein